jgi:C1A family cysteine protease
MSKMKHGVLKPRRDLRDFKLKMPVGVVKTYPESFTLDPPKHIKDQGQVNSCVAHSLSYIIDHYNLVQTGTDVEFSAGFIYGYRPDGYMQEEGMYVRDGLKTIQNIGDVPKTDFPYNEEVPGIITKVNDAMPTLKDKAYPNRVSSYFSLANDDAIKEALVTYKSYVTVNVEWYSDNSLSFIVDGQNTYTQLEKGTQYEGNHEITIYGWNKYGFLVANSWGIDWAKGGLGILPFSYGYDEAWAITDNINVTINPTPSPSPVIVHPKTNEFLDIIYKIANFFINLFCDIRKKLKK